MPALYTGQYDILCTLDGKLRDVMKKSILIKFDFSNAKVFSFLNEPVHVEDAVLGRGRMFEQWMFGELSIDA